MEAQAQESQRAGSPARGIYAHWPYCAHHCAYCDFNVATPRSVPGARYTSALLIELERRAPELAGRAETLYLGGGTPSLWAPADLARFVEGVRRAPGLEDVAEVTLEANPDDVDEERVAAWLRGGVNRVSVGLQALDDELLEAIDRRHDARTARAALRTLGEAELATWTVDLMFGLPGQGMASWLQTVEEVVDAGPPHLSLYALTVEPRTMLARRIERGEAPPVDDDLQAELLLEARRLLAARGYVHYEVSSWARPGHRGRHNSAYWHGGHWLGLGAGAHGDLPGERWVNLRRPRRYIEAVEAGDSPVATSEVLAPATRAWERLMTGLRDLERGVDVSDPAMGPYTLRIEREVVRGRLERLGTRIRVTERGLLFLDDVLLDLML